MSDWPNQIYVSRVDLADGDTAGGHWHEFDPPTTEYATYAHTEWITLVNPRATGMYLVWLPECAEDDRMIVAEWRDDWKRWPDLDFMGVKVAAWKHLPTPPIPPL